MSEFISSQNTLISETYDSYFMIFLNENYELIFNCLNQHDEDNEMSLNDFEKNLLQLYNTEDELFFKYITKSISANIGFEDFFHPITSYNHKFKDWKESNKEKDDLEFYSDDSYAWLSDVQVFGFKTKNTLCLFHDGRDDYNYYQLFQIKHNNIQSQLNDLIKTIENDS